MATERQKALAAAAVAAYNAYSEGADRQQELWRKFSRIAAKARKAGIVLVYNQPNSKGAAAYMEKKEKIA